MSAAIDFGIAPFDALTAAERTKVESALDVAYYPQFARILAAGEAPDHLFVVVKGIVGERAGDEIVNLHAEHDTFDAQALIEGRARHAFVAHDETVCQLLPKAVFLDLLRTNQAFAAFYTHSVAERMRAQIGGEAAHQMTGFLTARVRQAYVEMPVFVPPETPLAECAGLMRELKVHTLLVRAGGRVGVATRTDLGNAVLLQAKAIGSPVGDIAQFDLISIGADELLSAATVLMARHGIRRLIVTDNGTIVGVLELPSLLGFLSDNSHLIAIEIKRARAPAELRHPAEAIAGLIRTSLAQGSKVRVICDLVTELNRSLMRRLFELVAPAGLGGPACLVVMGSEGRGEQLLKTDQDNALLLGEGADRAEAARAATSFGERLAELGYPPCPGGMMASNPAWAKPLAEYRADLHRWMAMPAEDSYLNLAALFDAAPVAGEAGLIETLRGELIAAARGNQAFLSNFARPTLSFETPRVILPQFLLGFTPLGQGLDIKKAAIFPIVHGVRSMALELGIEHRNTLRRIEALVEGGVLDAKFAADLAEAFQFALGQRLKQQLARLGSGDAADGERNNAIELEKLGRTEMHLLRDALQVVIEFRKIVSHRFRLAMF